MLEEELSVTYNLFYYKLSGLGASHNMLKKKIPHTGDTDAESRTNTNLKMLHDLFILFFS